MGYYLQDNPTARPQYRAPRRLPCTGAIVIHTTESSPDIVGEDSGAENVAEWMLRRTTPGSYHRLVDADTVVSLVDFANEAYHDGTGGNRWSIGLSVATQARLWASMPSGWVDAAIGRLAEAAAEAHFWLLGHGYPGCPPRLITDAEYRAGAAGFIAHGTIDPGRRSDPGTDFPWDMFLERYEELISDPTTDPEEDPMDTVRDIEAYVAAAYRSINLAGDAAGQFYWISQATAGLMDDGPAEAWRILQIMTDQLGITGD